MKISERLEISEERCEVIYHKVTELCILNNTPSQIIRSIDQEPWSSCEKLFAMFLVGMYHATIFSGMETDTS